MHGEEIKLLVNELDSVETQIPYDYYMLNFCHPEDGIHNNFENLGSMLLGEKTQNSPYKIYMGINISCERICSRTLDRPDVNNFIWMMEHNYTVNMEIDNLPAILNKTN